MSEVPLYVGSRPNCRISQHVPQTCWWSHLESKSCQRVLFFLPGRVLSVLSRDVIAASIYDKPSIGPSTRPIYTICCFTLTSMIQVCSNFHRTRVFIMNTRPDEMARVVNTKVWTLSRVAGIASTVEFLTFVLKQLFRSKKQSSSASVGETQSLTHA